MVNTDKYLLSKEELRYVLQDCLASLQERINATEDEPPMSRLHKEYISEIRATVNDLIKHNPGTADIGIVGIQIEVINQVAE
jgi:hypothetical protein